MKQYDKTAYLTFNEKWFLKHQKSLIFLLNFWLTKRWFRRRLRIDSKAKINHILQHAYHFEGKKVNGKIRVKVEIHTHWKYSKRIYFAFKYLWWVLHFIDWLLLDRFLPELSFGYFTLSQSPDPGNGLTTCDGFIQRYNNQYDTLEECSTDEVETSNWNIDTSQPNLRVGEALQNSTPVGTWNTFTKGFYSFDTTLLNNSEINDAAVNIYIHAFQSPQIIGKPKVWMVSSGQADNNLLVNADFFTTGSTLLADEMIIDTNLVFQSGYYFYLLREQKYYTFNLNEDGITNINKEGISAFATHYDYASLAWVSDPNLSKWIILTAYASDNEGTAEDPKLTVEYELTGQSGYQMIL